ncbi:AAA family ATPase [Hymenobacter arcticus]
MLIEEIRVQGYKSLVDATLHVRPLTLLAGTNSSGKSSIMQPLLLIKQTMEAPYQPAGALVLDGSHVQAETAGELVSKNISGKSKGEVELRIIGNEVILDKTDAESGAIHMIYAAIEQEFSIVYQETIDNKQKRFELFGVEKDKKKVAQWLYDELGVFDDRILKEGVKEITSFINGFLQLKLVDNQGKVLANVHSSSLLENSIAALMHIPGLRGAPRRNYSATTFRNQIKGTFDLYAAGTISQWQQQNNAETLAQLNEYLQRLGLSNAVKAKVKNANEIELSVNRLPVVGRREPKKFERKSDMVNIADVGIGVSQVLPILVALIAAQEGQIVYVEQPELHLHPRAQVAMGELLAEAANRGVRVIVETHSSLLLLTVQTLIAQGKIANTDVGLHWFTRDAKGASQVQYVQPDEDGAYGAWPEDFSEIELKAQDAYLTAVGLRQFGEAAQ